DFEGMPLLATRNPIKSYGTALSELVIFDNQSKWLVKVKATIHAKNPIFSFPDAPPYRTFKMEVPLHEKRGFGREHLPLIFDGKSPHVSKIDNVTVRFPDGSKIALGVSLNTRTMLSLSPISESPSKRKLRCTIKNY